MAAPICHSDEEDAKPQAPAEAQGSGVRTIEEIVERLKSLQSGDEDDFFGVVVCDLLNFLPFARAKEWLKPEATEQDWQVKTLDRKTVIHEIETYMPFAWDKANDCRGLSASRSIDHMRTWLWLLRDDDLAEKIKQYSMYGKPQLRAICRAYNLEWESYDNGEWLTAERDSPLSPDCVPDI